MSNASPEGTSPEGSSPDGSGQASPLAKLSSSRPTSPAKRAIAKPTQRPSPLLRRGESERIQKPPDDSETYDGSPSKLPYDPFSCAMTSCPDLEGTKNWSSRDNLQGLSLPRDESRRNWARRSSRSQPPSPSSLMSSVALRFRSVRVWRSIGGGSTQGRSPPKSLEVSSGFLGGRERRRRAHETTLHHSSETPASVSGESPLKGEGKNLLAIAGMVLATSELDRLSSKARRDSIKHLCGT